MSKFDLISVTMFFYQNFINQDSTFEHYLITFELIRFIMVSIKDEIFATDLLDHIFKFMQFKTGLQ